LLRTRSLPTISTVADPPSGFYHDSRFATLEDVVNHYDNHFRLGLSAQQKEDLIKYLNSLSSAQSVVPHEEGRDDHRSAGLFPT